MAAVELDNDQRGALEMALRGHNVAVIGVAGTGKSLFIHVAYSALSDMGKKVMVTASTGMAALNLKGLHAQTLHSFTGILDGRYSIAELEERLRQDEGCMKVKKCIQSTDVLIIDEASLISARTFELAEKALRISKDSSHLFGGAQVIAIMDPRQLPPVPDALYQDEGLYCFESEVWKAGIPHKCFLNTPHRHQDPLLLQVVEETFSGNVSQETENLLKWLERPLPPSLQPVKICADNFSVERHNRAALDALPGEMTIFRADDEGDENQLNRIRVPKILALKEGSRVMLLKNISQKKGLVNGAQGKVINIEPDCITVLFGSVTVRLGKELFSRYSPEERHTLASRQQFPLCLSYAITFHKAQGQELEAVEVDAKGIFKPGMLGVGVSRVRSLKGLRVLNYRSGKCPPPSEKVQAYISTPGHEPSDDLNCCRKEAVEDNIDVRPVLGDARASDNTASDLSDSTLLLAIELQEGHGDIDTGGNYPQAPNLLKQSKCEREVTKEQQVLNKCINGIEVEKAEIFCGINHKALMQKLTGIDDKVTAARETDYSSLVCSYVESEAYRSTVKALFGTTKVNTIQFQAASRLVFQMFSQILLDAAQRKRRPQEELPAIIMHKIKNLEKHDSAGAKLRYVAGSVLARLSYRVKKVVRNHLYDKNLRILSIGDQKLAVYEVLEQDRHEETAYPQTLREIDHRRSGKLFTPADKVYEFFVSMEENRLKLHTFHNLTTFGNCMPGVVTQQLLGNTLLRDQFTAICGHPTQFPSDSTSESTAAEVADMVLQSLINKACTISEVRKDIILLFLKSGNKKFREEVLSSLKVKKKEAHRRNIQKRKAKRAKETPKKTKKQKNKQVAASCEDEDSLCHACGEEYVEGEPWVSCDGCEAWFEKRCTDIDSDTRWENILEGTEPWFCEECLARL